MRRAALAVLALAALVALGWGSSGGGLTCPPGFHGGGLTGNVCIATVVDSGAPPYFAFLPPDGGGAPVAQNLCDALASTVPAWSSSGAPWCLYGDGGVAAGSALSFAAFGAPTQTTTTICPSGPSCTQAAALTLYSDSGIASSTTVDSSTTFSICWYGKADLAAQEYLMSLATADSNAGIAWRTDYVSGLYRFSVSNGGSLSISTGASEAPQQLDLVCGAYANPGAPEIYVNGVAGSGGVNRNIQALTAKPTINGINGAANTSATAAQMLGAFYIDIALDAGVMATIAHAVLADQPQALINGTPSLAMTYTRTGSRYCGDEDGGTIIPANRPCIAKGGLLVEATAANSILRSQEFEQAWCLFSSGDGTNPTRTANVAVAPDGTLTADRVTFSATTSSGRSIIYQEPGGTKLVSVYIKGVLDSGVIDVTNDSAGTSANGCACAYSANAWTRCVTVAAGAGAVVIGNDGSANGCGSKSRSAADVYLWGAQVESGSVATSYIPTTSAGATRGYDLPYFDMGTDAGVTAKNFSLSATRLSASSAASTGQSYASLARAAPSAFQGDTAGHGIWLYSPGTIGVSFACIQGPDGVGPTATNAVAASLTTAPLTMSCSSDGGTFQGIVGGTNTNAPATPAGTYSPLRWVDIGTQQGSPGLNAIGGYVGNVCLSVWDGGC